MTIHELDPIFSLGPVPLGKKLGKCLNTAPITERTIWIRHHIPEDVYRGGHDLVLRVRNADVVNVQCMCLFGTLGIEKEQINEHYMTRDILRWSPTREK